MSPFFFWPYWYAPYTSWYYYPPLTFSDNYPSYGCPYDDYYYQQQGYYQPQQEAPEQPESGLSAEGTEEAAAPPAEAPQAPFSYEKPLPDVIEWGTASEAESPTPAAPASKGPLVVNLPHHTLTILPSNPGPPATTGP